MGLRYLVFVCFCLRCQVQMYAGFRVVDEEVWDMIEEFWREGLFAQRQPEKSATRWTRGERGFGRIAAEMMHKGDRVIVPRRLREQMAHLRQVEKEAARLAAWKYPGF